MDLWRKRTRERGALVRCREHQLAHDQRFLIVRVIRERTLELAATMRRELGISLVNPWKKQSCFRYPYPRPHSPDPISDLPCVCGGGSARRGGAPRWVRVAGGVVGVGGADLNGTPNASNVVACQPCLSSSIASRSALREPMNDRPRRPLAGDVRDKGVVPGLPYRGYGPLLVMVVR